MFKDFVIGSSVFTGLVLVWLFVIGGLLWFSLSFMIDVLETFITIIIG